MPLKDDSLTQLMDKSAQLILAVKEQSEGGDTAGALETLEAAYRDYLGSNTQLIGMMTSEQLLEVLRSGGLFNSEKAILMADLLYAELSIRQATSAPSSDLGKKSLDLYLEALREEAALIPTYRERVDELSELLEPYDLGTETERRLFEYHALQGDYAEAENHLYDLMERLGGERELLQRGRRFYAELQKLPDDTLEQGGLPREEVEEGLRNLERFK